MHLLVCMVAALLGLFGPRALHAQETATGPTPTDDTRRAAPRGDEDSLAPTGLWPFGLPGTNELLPGVLGPEEQERPLTVFRGIPSYVRHQTWWLLLYVQDIPVLDPLYWDRAIGDPWSLQRGTEEKMLALPSVARMYFYGYYMGSLQRFHFTPNPARGYGPLLGSAWTPVFLEEEGDSPTFFEGLGNTLGNRFSPEEGADLLFGLLTRLPGAPQSRETWQGWKMLTIYSGFWLSSAWLAYQLARDQGLIRAGRWFRFRDSEFAVGTFASLGNLGVSLKPSVSADIRFVVPGVEAAFGFVGRVNPDPRAENLAFENGIRVNWLRSFWRSLGWDVFAFAGARYGANVTGPDNERHLRFSSSINARRENFVLDGLTMGLDSGVSTDAETQAGYFGSVTMERGRDGLVAGARFSVLRFRDRVGEELGTTVFVALPSDPERLLHDLPLR